MNLLQETIECMKENGVDFTDVSFIGSADGKYGMSCADFCAIADKEYDDGYGSAEVATDLIISFSDGSIMYRGEYDGSEWWNFRKPFKVPEEYIQIKDIFVGDGFYDTIDKMN